MHQARFKVRYTIEAEVKAQTPDIGAARAAIGGDFMRGVSVSSYLHQFGPLQMGVTVDLVESVVVPQIVSGNGRPIGLVK